MEHVGHLRLLNEDRQRGYYNRLGTSSESHGGYPPGLSRCSVYVERRVAERRVTIADIGCQTLEFRDTTVMSVTTAIPLSRCCRIISPAPSWNADSGPQVQPTIPMMFSSCSR